MDLINPGNFKVGSSGLPWFLYFLRVLALVCGYTLAGPGWLTFVMFLMVMGFGHLDHGDADFFQIIGIPVTAGWLLLRLSAGLFPFSRRFFQWQKYRA
jgi:uncharacterized membrane protein YccF (DUF307 family)